MAFVCPVRMLPLHAQASSFHDLKKDRRRAEQWKKSMSRLETVKQLFHAFINRSQVRVAAARGVCDARARGMCCVAAAVRRAECPLDLHLHFITRLPSRALQAYNYPNHIGLMTFGTAVKLECPMSPLYARPISHLCPPSMLGQFLCARRRLGQHTRAIVVCA